jgi:enoyl-CoA hydratase
MNVINYAVPADQLDAKVDELVQALLRRSAFALAWTKRTCNRGLVDHLNMTLDAAAAYEMVNFLQLERLGGVDPMSLEED